jgi:hypothetical protein
MTLPRRVTGRLARGRRNTAALASHFPDEKLHGHRRTVGAYADPRGETPATRNTNVITAGCRALSPVPAA